MSDTSLLPAPSRNLPAIRTPATVARIPKAAPAPRLGPVARTVLMTTVVATPIAGLMVFAARGRVVTAFARRIGLRRERVPLALAVGFGVMFLVSFAAGFITTG